MQRCSRLGIGILALVALLALPTALVGCGGSDETVGRIMSVDKKRVFIGSSEAREGDDFRPKTRLTTDSSGTVDFELDSGTGCRTRANSDLRIEPDRRISIHFRTGRSTCWKDPGAKPQTYLARDVLVTAEDPVFGVTVDADETVVQVMFGFVEVDTTTIAEAPVVVGPDQQAVVAPGQATPRLEKIELAPADERIADELEDRLPKEKAEPPGGVDELVLGVEPSAPDAVRSFTRRLLATWDIDVQVEAQPDEELEKSLRQGTVDVVLAPRSEAPPAAMRLFTRQGTTWTLVTSPGTLEEALEKLITVSLQSGAYGDLYAEAFASEPTYARAGGSEMTVIAAEEHGASTTITKHPPSRTSSTTATFEFESSNASALFSCELDDLDPEPCESPRTYVAIEPGTHTFTVRATDAAETAERPDSYTWSVTPTGGEGPATRIISGPEDETIRTDATFTFGAGEEAVKYGCSLDRTAFQPCESPKSYRDLPVGEHVFAVRAVDADENVGRSEKRSWTVVADPEAPGPRTRILAGPQRRTARTTAVFRFGSEPGANLSCSLDGTSFRPCTSPRTYRNLGQGRHTFAVRARAPNGRIGPEQTYSWSIDRQPPVVWIVDAPQTRTSERDASFSFRANEPRVDFSCSLDGGDFEPCSSPWQLEDLEVDAEHTFAVRATDVAGNIGEPDRFTWEVVFG